MNYDYLRLNPDYPYLRSRLQSEREQAEKLIAAAIRIGKPDHPVVAVMRDNLAIIERQETS